MMKEVRAIVVDDERRARDVLNKLLERNCPIVNVVAMCVDVLSAVDKIKELKPDVVFLDVEMPDYAGYELVNFFNEINFEIIFVTAFDQYAIKAFELSAIDYLVKPIERLRLVDAVDRVSKKVNSNESKVQYEQLLNSIKEKEFKKIVIPELGNKRIIEINNITAIEAEGSYCKIHQLNNNPFVISKNLKYFEERLGDSKSFFRTHRGWLVNINHIESINKTDLTLHLCNNLVAKISRTMISSFESYIG